MPAGKGFLGGVAACFIDWVPSARNRGVYLTTPIATEPAFLAARLNFESVIDKNAAKLTDAGRHAAAQIGNQLNQGAAQLVAANLALERKMGRFVLLLVGFALVAGAVGGFVGARLAGL
ncbi:hypothetical protein [Pandoraea oxalativorans]|uniref:hypothetical protein n=1 Tax=Pandoraea oxalativorans TaxID=573737 RepID=UPI000AC0B4DC